MKRIERNQRKQRANWRFAMSSPHAWMPYEVSWTFAFVLMRDL